MSSSDTIVALATPLGTSAIAVVRASGPDVRGIVHAIFGEVPAARSAQHADYRDRGNVLIDDVIFTFFAGPNSYTGEDVVEISTHGNPLIAQKVMLDLVARGGRLAEAGEFTKRAFLNGRMDLSQAEAVMDLIHARSERALAAANQQLRGALGRRVNELIELTVNCLAQIEAYIDFPEEDLPPENRTALLEQLGRVEIGVSRLLATSKYGEMLRSGIRTVIIGEPNAGKSSLLNQLVGRDRALVSPEPGTTRDYLEETVSVGPHVLRLIDTAGLNPVPSGLERRGIDKTFEQAAEADLYLWVVDATRPLPSLPDPVQERLAPANAVLIVNKTDLANTRFATAFDEVRVSALHGTGIDELRVLIGRRADAYQTEVGAEFVAVNARHAESLASAVSAIVEARSKLEQDAPAELVASELRAVLEALGQIAGKIDHERVLDVLFSSFCIGK